MTLSLIFAALFFLTGCFFKFALLGYGTLAALFWALAALIFLLAVLKKRGARRTRRVVLALALLAVLAVGLLEIPIVRAARTDAPDDTDYLIILGAGVNGSTPSLSLTNRLNAALDYLEAHPDTVAIVTGGQGEGEDITEAEAMRVWLEGRGLAPERILTEARATNTEENIAYSLDIIDARGGAGATIAIASSEYHLYRAKCMARAQGVETFGVAAETTRFVLKLNYFLREAFAVAYMKVFG